LNGGYPHKNKNISVPIDHISHRKSNTPVFSSGGE